MGLTCANIHIFAGGRDTPMGGPTLIGELNRACGQLGYEQVEDTPPTECQLVAVVAPPWISALLPLDAGVLTEDLAKLARQLSSSTGCPVLLTSVYDSDELAFFLFERGKQLDGYASQDDFVSWPFKKWSVSKRAREWSRIFVKMMRSADVQKVSERRSSFADDQLDELCRLVGLPIEQSRIKVDDLEDSLRHVRPVCFRIPSAPRSSTRAVTQVGGQTGFQANASMSLELLVGETKPLAFELSAPTESLSGPQFIVSGTAIDQRLVELASTGLIWHCGIKHVRSGGARTIQAQLLDQLLEGRRVVQVQFPDLTAAGLRQAPLPDVTLACGISLRASAEGSGDLCFSFIPEATSKWPIALRPQYHVQVVTPRWIPLRATWQGPAAQDGLKMLNRPRILSGVMIVEDRQAESITGIKTLIESWLSFLAPIRPSYVSTVYEGQMVPPVFRVPRRKSTLTMNEVGIANKWRKMFDQSPSLQSLFLQVVDDGAGKAWAGASIQRMCDDAARSAAGTIHVAFWFESPLDGRAEELDASRERLTYLIDSTFDTLAGLQAWVARWDWVPRFSMAEENDYTPYEDACSLGSPSAESDRAAGSYMLQEWCRRRLRGLSERLWLSASLVANIDREKLRTVANMTNIGPNSIRVDLHNGEQLNRLEQALEPILPAR